jgi:predicted nucleotidyltransferase
MSESFTIVNKASSEKIPEKWKEPVKDVIKAYQEHLGENLHSVYILGSVARGNPREGVSDLDTLAVVKDESEDVDLPWKEDLRKVMYPRYPFIYEVDVDVVSIEEVSRIKWYRVLLKLESACVYGIDMSRELPEMQPGEDTRISMPATKRRIEATMRALDEVTDEEELKEWSRGVTRRMIRSAYELIEVEEGKYTRELEKCVEVFSLYYPDQADSIRKALEITRVPSSNKDETQALLQTFGKWLIVEIERKFPGISDGK